MSTLHDKRDPRTRPLPAEETARRARVVADRIRAGDLSRFRFPDYDPRQLRLVTR